MRVFADLRSKPAIPKDYANRLRTMSKTKDAHLKKILVRAPNWIGDAVMCLPALRALKALYPGAGITVLARPLVHAVFENNPDCKDLIEYDSKGRHKGIKGRLRLSGEIRRRGFDMAVLFQNAFDAAFISFISRIPKRVGYARDLRTRLLTMPIPVSPEILKRHQVYYYLNIIEALGGGPVRDPAPRIALSEEERTWAMGFLEKNGVWDKMLVGASPGASYGPAKRWAPGHFASALDRLADHLGAVPVIFGGLEDMEACSDVSGRLKAKHLNLAGMLDLRQFMAVLSETALFITNDSGPMHIAAALQVPTVAIFGSTDKDLTGPVSKTSVTITKDLECSPCFKRECAFGHYECLENVSAGEVFTAGAGLLKRNLGWPV